MKVVHCKKEPYDVYIGRPGIVKYCERLVIRANFFPAVIGVFAIFKGEGKVENGPA